MFNCILQNLLLVKWRCYVDAKEFLSIYLAYISGRKIKREGEGVSAQNVALHLTFSDVDIWQLAT
jgi:hypothetical protein